MICATCGGELRAEHSPASTCPACSGPVLLAGRYALAGVLGRGANGITYRAARVADGTSFAVKEIPVRTLESAKALELFEREARVLRELSHPAIPRYEEDFVFGTGKSAALYLVQELVDGKTLAEEMASRRYDVSEVLAIVAEVAAVLDYLHRRTPAVIHRDIKPKNVMRRKDGRLVLIDFGSVRDALSRGGGSTVAGTFGYMAPEQLAGKATPASDVYGLGALAVALLTRKEPDTLLDERHRIPVREHVRAPEPVQRLLELMLEPAPDKRLARASDVRGRAQKLASGKHHEKKRPKQKRPNPDPAPEPKPSEAPAPREETVSRPATRETRDEATIEAQAQASANRATIVFIGVALAFAGLFALIPWLTKSHRETVNARSTVGVPELYARPLAVDVNGDGAVDVLSVVGVDRGPEPHEDDDDAWGKENGRFSAYVQAFDGRTGNLLYAIGTGDAYTSLGNDAKTSERIVLVATSSRLGIARVPPSGRAKLTIHELATGTEKKSLALDSVTGEACAARGGSTFLFRTPAGGLVEVDLDAMTVRGAGATAACEAATSARVADVPQREITDRSSWSGRFSVEVPVPDGPLRGKTGTAAPGGHIAFLLTAKANAPTPAREVAAGITISSSEDAPPVRDNTKLEVVAVELPSGLTRFARPLASLGFRREIVSHIEVPPGAASHALLFFTGAKGLALVDGRTGEKRWALPLPKGHRISRYALTATHAYLHVFGPGETVYGFLSKKLGSRILVVDLASGQWVRSLPEGPLEPDPPPPAAYAYDRQAFPPVAGCTCELGARSPGAPRSGARSDAGALPLEADAAAPRTLQLGMYTRSTVQSGGRTRFGVAWAFDVAGTGFALPHYNELRVHIAPPPVVEGELSLALACSEDVVVVACETVVTAWSLTARDELWTVDLPRSRAEPQTTLGGGARIACARGVIDRVKGRVELPATNGAIVLSLGDGQALGAADAGAAR